MSPAEEAAAKEAAESKGVVKFGWVKGVLVSHLQWIISHTHKCMRVCVTVLNCSASMSFKP